MNKLPSLFVTLLAGAAMLIAVPASMRAQDNWVQVPSSHDSSDSEAAPPTSQDTETAGEHPQRGSDDAQVTIIEYSDFQCPFCRRAESSIRQVLKKYHGQVRLVYMDYPLASHRYAMDAAIAARCAGEQGEFWTYHDALFENPSNLTTPGLKATAQQVGLDPLTFDRCLEERKFENAVRADQKDGDAAGLRGIPYFIVDGQVLHGASTPAAFYRVIDREMQSR